MGPLFGALALACAPNLLAAQPVLDWPVDCTLGQTCFIEDYVDADPTKGRQGDFACGINSRDGHRGTDIALLSFDEIAEGVAVRASAPGRVLRIRDSMPDDRLMRGVTSQTACGNAVLVDHGEGWQTLYCHLRLGSVAVSVGQQVKAGDRLGMVGLSGQTNHPHLHLTVLKDGEVVDPFDPDPDQTCGPVQDTLWAETPDYYQTGLVTAGFSDHVPTLDDVRTGAARRDTGARDAPLVVYAHIGYGENGDVLEIEASGPDGQIFERSILIKDPQASVMRAFGKKAPPGGWSRGEYLGEATLLRDGRVIAHRFAHVTVE
jgi:hypothetical protein